MGLSVDKIEELANAIIAAEKMDKPRGYVSRAEKQLRRLDIEDYDAVVQMVHNIKMKDPAAMEEELRHKREEHAAQNRKPGIFDHVTAGDIALEFHEASQLGARGKTPARHVAYDGGGKIEQRTSVSYTGGDGGGGPK